MNEKTIAQKERIDKDKCTCEKYVDVDQFTDTSY